MSLTSTEIENLKNNCKNAERIEYQGMMYSFLGFEKNDVILRPLPKLGDEQLPEEESLAIELLLLDPNCMVFNKATPVSDLFTFPKKG